jgi:hypothetical protein
LRWYQMRRRIAAVSPLGHRHEMQPARLAQVQLVPLATDISVSRVSRMQRDYRMQRAGYYRLSPRQRNGVVSRMRTLFSIVVSIQGSHGAIPGDPCQR